ncbi:MAG: hypothetical protein ACRDRT_07530, partial [Pseudonocardiaceae bacterium]
REVVETARDEVQSLALAVRAEASQIFENLGSQGHDFLDDTRAQFRDQAEIQTGKLAASLRTLGREAGALAQGRPEQAGYFADFMREMAGRIDQVADEVEDRGLDGLAKDVEHFARSRPGVFIAASGLAGLAAGRLLRGARDESKSARDGVFPAGRHDTRRKGSGRDSSGRSALEMGNSR